MSFNAENIPVSGQNDFDLYKFWYSENLTIGNTAETAFQVQIG